MKVDRHELTGNCPQLLQLLAEAQASDKRAEKEKSKGNTVGCIGCGTLFASFFVIGPMMENGLAIPPLLLGAAALAACIWGFMYAHKHSQFDLDDDKLATLRRAIEMLANDTRPKDQVQTMIDFRAANTDPFLQQKETVGSSYYGDVMAYNYQQPWLSLTGRLMDRTSYKVEVTRLMKSKVKPKKKGRRKVKSRLMDRISIAIRTDPARYPDLAPLTNGLPDPPLGMKIRAFQAQSNQIRATFETPLASRQEYRGMPEETNLDKLASADTVLASLVYLYRGIKGVKAQSMG